MHASSSTRRMLNRIVSSYTASRTRSRASGGRRSRSRAMIWTLRLVRFARWPGGYSSSRSRALIASPSGSRNRHVSWAPSTSMRRRCRSGTCWQIKLSDRPAARMRLAPSNSAQGSTLAANSDRLPETPGTSARAPPPPGGAPAAPGRRVAIVEYWADARVCCAACRNGNAVGRAGLEELRGGVSGQHVLQHTAVIGIWETAYVAGQPAVELGAARRAVAKVTVQGAGSFLVDRAESPISVQAFAFKQGR